MVTSTELSAQDAASMVEADFLRELLKKELDFSREEHDGYLYNQDSNMISNEDRMALIDWCYGIVDHCRYSRETVALAIEMVDRFMFLSNDTVSSDDDAINSNVSDEIRSDKFKYQLLTVTALYVAIKINESTVVSSDLFADICREAYTKKEIEDMERILLSVLSWRCRAPTALQIGQTILSLIFLHSGMPDEICDLLADEMKYQTELAVRDSYFSTQRPSTVAVAAILYAIQNTIIEEHEDQAKVLESFVWVVIESFNLDGKKRIFEAAERFNNSSDR